MKASNLLIVLAVGGISFTSTSLLANDNSKLLAAYEADQKARSEENLKNGNFPKYSDEMTRRLFVFEELANGRITTAADFVHAAELDHPDGMWLMAATYNRYIENRGLNIESYGLLYRDGVLKAVNKDISDADRATKGLPQLPAIAYQRDE